MARFFILMVLLFSTVNSFAQDVPSVVINEIMYHPVSDKVEDEYIEIYNADTRSIDLSGWYVDGIRFSIPEGTSLGFDEYLVIAKDPSIFLEQNGIVAHGPYDGVLRDSGETLTLKNHEGQIVDQVTYGDREPWPVMADGMGSSLECIHPLEDNAHPRNWRASHFSTGWNYCEVTDVASGGILSFSLEGDGECLLDDVRLVSAEQLGFQVNEWFIPPISSHHLSSGIGGKSRAPSEANQMGNLVVNGGFESEEAWLFSGSHSDSYFWPGDAHEGSRCLRVVSAGEVTGFNNKVAQYVDAVEEGKKYTLSFWYKNVSGLFTLTTKMSGGSHLREISLTGHGSPGRQNFVFSDNVPPFVTDIAHQPQEPQSDDSVSITAFVEDLYGIQQVDLLYKVDRGDWQEIPMLDTGTQGDEQAGDDVYTAVLPPQSFKTIVRYKIHAEDMEGRVTQRPYTNQLTPNYGYFVYDPETSSDLPIYWMFLNDRDYNDLLANPGTDELKRGAFVYEGTLYDNVGIRFRGQWARSWPKKSWKLRFNKDNYFQGRRTVNLNSCYHDRAYIREYLCYRFYREAGVYACKSRFAEVRLNGEFYGVELDVEQVNEQFLRDRGFDPEGNLYKSKQDGDLRPLGSVHAYKGPFEKKTNEDEEWYDLKELADGLALTPSNQMKSYLQQNVDVNNILNYWAATTIIQNWDSIIKNHYLFHDTQSSGYWYMFPWDLDRTWGEYANWNLGARINILAGMQAHPPGFGLPSDWWNRLIDALLKQPEFRDRYYHFIRVQLDEIFTQERMNEWIDIQYQLIKDLVPKDKSKWGSHGDWDFEEEIENCKEFVVDRRVFLYDSLPTNVDKWLLY